MKSSVALHEVFNYTNPPFTFREIHLNDTGTYIVNPHWHEELEIVYTLRGNHRHYINGRCYESAPGRLLTVKVSNPHFKWGFSFNPSGVLCRFRQRRGLANHYF